MKNLCQRIQMPPEVTEEVLKLHHDPLFQPDISGLMEEDRWTDALKRLQSELGEDPRGLKGLCCMLRCALQAGEKLEGLPERVCYDTFACFTRFVREHRESYGVYGFDRGFWTVRQVSGLLLRIGELEYERTYLEGKPAISLHIPSDAHLDGDSLHTSWEQAKQVMSRLWPGWGSWPVFCRSWLLSPDLQALLPEHSRILAFQKAFAITPLADPSSGYVQWVFKDPRLAPADYPEDTSLQRNLKAWLLQGNTFTNAIGILKKEGF